MAAQENASRIPFTDELPPHITLEVVTRVVKVALRIAIQGIPEAPTGHEHHGFSIAVGDGDELMKMQDEGDGPEPVYFAPYDLNPFERGHLDIDENSVIRGAFNGDGLCVVDGRTAKCRAATMIVLSMRGGGKTGGGRHKSSRALSKQPGGGCWVLKCSEDDRGSKFKKFHVFFKGLEAEFLKAAPAERRPAASEEADPHAFHLARLQHELDERKALCDARDKLLDERRNLEESIASRRAFLAAMMVASPRLMEPIFMVEIQCPEGAMGGVYSSLNRKRGTVVEETNRPGTPLYNVKAYLPVAESFGFTGFLRQNTGGQAFPQMVFHHWETMMADPFKDDKLIEIITAARKRKGLKETMPPLSEYEDKL